MTTATAIILIAGATLGLARELIGWWRDRH
jgi:hypothetical protein